ncbi:MAG: leucine-rich repeat domain-containing protein [Promethearchaeota archaeon]
MILKGNGLKKIECLENLSNLKSLDLSENYLTEIEGLETLKNLESLSFGSTINEINSIREIKG